MQGKRYRIRTMNRNEVDTAVQWAAEEGWNPGLSDADCYYTADPNGFLVGLLDEEPIASLSAIRYGDTFGFLGFYIVQPAHRGQGYGIQLWNAGMEYLQGVNIGLDGVVDQQDNYRKSGFKLAWRNIRFEGTGGGTPPSVAGLVELTSLPFEVVQAYQRPFFPADRSPFIKAWINQPGCKALGIMQDGNLVASGVIRPCRSGFKIGPLLADSPELAETLFQTLKATADPSAPIFLDAPEVNPEAVALAERHGLHPAFETARMYTGPTPNLPLDRLFSVTSFEIG